MKMIEQGHHLLPWFGLPGKDLDASFVEFYEGPMRRARQLHLPLVIVGTQWEKLLSVEPYLSLSPEQNPNVVTPEGKILPKVCPFGLVEPWRKVGASWTSSPVMKWMQEWYPDPPLVIFLSNNEHGKLQWNEVETSNRYLEKYGKGKAPEFMRKVVADGWIERYRGLQQGMREGLVNRSWQEQAMFVGYDAFGPPHFGRWSGWGDYSLHSDGRIAPYPLMWDGGSPSYYTNNWNSLTDYTVFSPQVESMNWVFMQHEAQKLNPKFWLELSTWDGNATSPSPPNKPWKREVYERAGQTYNPQRYGGYVQFGMWLLRPRAVREFRSWTESSELGMPYFMAIVDAVDRVYANATLREFWRKGELVPNRTHKHPYQSAIPKEYQNEDRWFLLDADVNPKQYVWQSVEQPKAGGQKIPVFSLALVQGKSPARRWLVYAHSPLKDRKDVKITIPDYREITMDVSVSGAFYLIDETDGSVKAVR